MSKISQLFNSDKYKEKRNLQNFFDELGALAIQDISKTLKEMENSNQNMDKMYEIAQRTSDDIDKLCGDIFLDMLSSTRPRDYYEYLRKELYPRLQSGEYSPEPLKRYERHMLFCPLPGEKSDNNRKTYVNIHVWQLMFEILRKFDRPVEAECVLLDWWNINTLLQLNKGVHIYRAMAAYELAKFLFARNELSSAYRWFLLSHIDDCLNEYYLNGKLSVSNSSTKSPDSPNTRFAGSGYHLSMFVQFSDKELKNIIEDVKKTINEAECKLNQNDLWRSHFRFPEYHFTHFMVHHFKNKKYNFKNKKYNSFPKTHLFLPTKRVVHPLNPYFVKLFHKWIMKNERTNSEKGDGYELLTVYLFTTIDGFLPFRNSIPDDKAFQNDILIINTNPSNLSLQHLLGNKILVECKNRSKKVSASEVGYFVARMLAIGCNVGVIMSQKGITGEDRNHHESKYALALARRFQPELRILSIKDKHIKALYDHLKYYNNQFPLNLLILKQIAVF